MTSFSTFKPTPQDVRIRFARAKTEAALKKEMNRLKAEGWLPAGEVRHAAPTDKPNANGEFYCLMVQPK
jgi:hypothetical protein